MQKRYRSSKIEKFYSNRRTFQKKFGKYVSDGLCELLDAIDAAISAYDIKCIPYFWMHELHNDKDGLYSLSVDNKKTKWRMIVKCLNDNEEWVKPGENEIEFLKGIKIFELGEFSEHYE